MLGVYAESGINLMLTFNPCTSSDIRSFQTDGLKFGLIRLGSEYCWLVRTGFAVFDAPYSPAIETPDRQALPWHQAERGPEGRAAIHLHVIDARGITRALKLVTVSPAFTGKFETVHAKTLAKGARTRAEWDREIADFNHRYATPKAAFKQVPVTSRGGE
jgi:hypothetical protein